VGKKGQIFKEKYLKHMLKFHKMLYICRIFAKRLKNILFSSKFKNGQTAESFYFWQTVSKKGYMATLENVFGQIEGGSASTPFLSIFYAFSSL
jgi:hypothetical protein